MSNGLFGFIFNTFTKRLNDPANAKYWLPRLLQGIDADGGGKLLPLKGADWNLGEITGEAGDLFRTNIKNQWWMGLKFIYKDDPRMKDRIAKEQRQHKPLACPDDQWPRMALPQVTVFGIDNMFVLGDPQVAQPGTGYSTVISLRLGYYTDKGLSQLRMEGRYALTQCVCSGKSGDAAPAQCDGWVPTERIHGTGTFKLSMGNVFLDADVDIRVAPSGSGKRIRAVVNQITVRGPQPGRLPDIAVDKQTVKTKDPDTGEEVDEVRYTGLTVDTTWEYMSDAVWIPSAVNALESADGRRGLVQNLNATLNEPVNRDRFASLITDKLNGAVDDTLGAVPPSGMPGGAGQQAPNPVDQYIFDRVRVALANPSSAYYLPKVVYGFNGPRLEPYQLDRISLGDQSLPDMGLDFRNVRFTDVRIDGPSNINAAPEQLLFKPDVIDATLALSALNPPPRVAQGQVPPPPLKVSGRFAADADGPPDEPLTGGFTLLINHSNIAASLVCSGQEVDELQIRFLRLQLRAALSAMSINASVDSTFADIINQMLNQDDIKTKALQGVNEKVTGSLGDISSTATQNVRQLIRAQLDG